MPERNLIRTAEATEAKVSTLERQVAELQAEIDRQQELLRRRRLAFLATYRPRSLLSP